VKGRFTFTDSYENTVKGSKKLVPALTVKGGEVYKAP